MLEKVIEFLRDKPGYSKEGGLRLSRILSSRGYDISPDICRQAIYAYNKEKEMAIEEDDLKYVSELKKSAQRNADLNRIERKAWRNRVRIENSLTELNSELIKAIQDESLSIDNVSRPIMKRSGNKIIVQLADLHLNELVDLDDNKYDFYVAASRLEKYANEAKMMAAIKEVDEILVAMTGDILNSDRRTDELLNAATNRAHASVLATKLIANFIMDLNSVANVAIISVTGNESRVREEFSLDNFLVSDSYDFLIYSMLKMLLENKDGVRFIKSDSYEAIVRINGANILLMHGTTVRKDTQQSIQQLIGKYAVKGNRIDYVIFGHIHFANVTDLYSRSGSLVGQNTYADRELNLISQASQIIHIIDADGSISNYRVNLQNADDYVGYEITSDYDAYEPRLSNYSSKNKIIEL